MNGWMYVFFAAVIEVIWVLGLKFSSTPLEWAGTVTAIIFSFYFIIKACQTLPSGTVYAVFTGSGAAAIALIDFMALGEPFSIGKAFCLALIITGVVGIQLTTNEEIKQVEK